MVATDYREGRFERAPARPNTASRLDLALWRRRCVAWCLRRTVRRGWTRIPAPAPVQRPLYSAGTLARIERVRESCPARPAARAYGPGSGTVSRRGGRRDTASSDRWPARGR